MQSGECMGFVVFESKLCMSMPDCALHSLAGYARLAYAVKQVFLECGFISQADAISHHERKMRLY